ncbi:EamA family transporter [Parahaliea maris]|uniref:EamA family transporter n=2 Tax=Parahaliea maris TaxID=2716870 RepID=A0A5C9A0F0_9GAMM|nr:EamA family transporter [Parahaliea maris]
MNNVALYILTVLIWGSTWIAIKYQLGEVSVLVSIGHRSMLAALLVFAFLLLRRQSLRLPLRQHAFVLAQGLLLFSGNYVFIYPATAELTSGLVAVVFSTMVILNMVGGALFLGIPASAMVAVGGALGLTGMAALFLPELQVFSLSDNSFRALLLCFAGTCCASVGNLFAARNTRAGLPVLVCNAWGMFYGAVALYLSAVVLGHEIRLQWQPQYLLSLLYLAVFGSVVAFWAYVTLIGRIGPDRAAYSSLLFPVVALLISTFAEGYQWSVLALLGLALVLAGNWLVMRRGAA